MLFLILLDTDCSGRMLATILVAWVMTAMIASILLQWEHMWIVLVILTLFFFLICIYTVYSVRKTHARILIGQQRSAIQTISDIAANQQTGSLPFAMRSTPDLPPSYASVMTVQETPAPAQTSTIDPLDENKFEDPPPYSIVVASIDMQERNAEVSEEQYVPPATSTKKDDSTVASATADLATMSHMCSQER